MSYMRSTDSAVLQEFGRIMQEKDELKKVAQVAPLSEDEKAKLQHALAELAKMPSNGPAMEKWVNRLKGQTDPQLKQIHDALAQRYQLWAEGKDAKEVGAVPLPAMMPQPDQMAKHPAPAAPVAAAPPARAALSVREKTADGKAYDVTPKEDLVHEAHPKSALVEGDVVENLNEQQDADLSVAEKSAKDVLLALYKLAKRLKAENNDRAYALVKETFLELSKSLKK